eukprot:gene10135-8036_t
MPVPTAVDPLKDSDRYLKLQDLSSGSFGFVQLARNKHTGECVAIKFIERGDRYVEAEILNHRLLRHAHVVEFKDIKLESTLLQMVPDLPLPLIKICDFGYSKAHFMSAPKSKVGTLAYMAPEVIKTTGNYDGKPADIWSCGVMLYVMLFGQYPFETAQQGATQGTQRVQFMMNRILAMQWSIPDGLEISSACHDLLNRMLVSDPEKRFSMKEIQQHPWFLTNLPPDALRMNDACMESTDYTGGVEEILGICAKHRHQDLSVEEILGILRLAQTPGPGKYTGASEKNAFEELIDNEILDEMVAHNSSFDPTVANSAPGKRQPQPT